MPASTEELLVSLGRPGKYQVLICFLLSLNNFSYVFNHLSMAFFGAEPRYVECDIGHDAGNDTIRWNSSEETIMNSNNSCQLFEFNEDRDSWCPIQDNCSSCNGNSKYIMEDREWTIVTEFDLVCDDQYLTSLVTSIYHIGYMSGSLVFGRMADSVGRLPTLIVTLYLSAVVGIGIFFAKSFVLFVILKFTVGALSQGVQLATITLVIESISTEYEPTAVYACILAWGFANMAMCLTAYLVRHWRWMQLWTSGLTFISVVYIWLLPESLRWLLIKQKYDRAEKLTLKIIGFNRKKEETAEVKSLLQKCKEEKTSPEDQQFGIRHLFLHKIMLFRTIVVGFIWFSSGLVYHGLILSTGTLHGSKYVNYFIGSGVEIAAFLVPFVLPKALGVRRPLIVNYLFGGIACIVAGNITDKTIKTGFSLTGRFFISGAFSLIFLFTGELYPTVFRGVGLGWGALWSGFGAIVAPQINLLGTFFYLPLASTLFGCMSVVAASLVMILPETSLNETADTLQEAEALGWGCCGGKGIKKLTKHHPNHIHLEKF